MKGQKQGADGTPGIYAQKKTELVLYDLQNDVGETEDVSGKYPEITKRLKNAANDFIKELGEHNQKGNATRPAGKHNENTK
jgi:hypothetical protein